jgi:AraC-like DNA-binding protein
MTRLAHARVRTEGYDALLLLKKAGLTAAQIDDPASRINVRDQVRFLNLAAEALHDDLLGFHLAQVAELREAGLLYYIMSSSEMLTEALQRCGRYSSIVNEGIRLKYDDRNDLRVAFDCVAVSRHLDRHQVEFVAATLVRISRQLTGRELTPSRVKFVHHRNKVSHELSQLLGRKIQFGASTDEIVFAAPAASAPLLCADMYLNRLLTKYCEEALARRPSHFGVFRPVIENAIVPLLPHGGVQVDDIARRLSLTQRTLARRLSMEGTTFSGVLEDLRSDLARRYLTDKTLSISHIAWLLGYQEASAFAHAFKRWTGKTPREARRELSGSSG